MQINLDKIDISMSLLTCNISAVFQSTVHYVTGILCCLQYFLNGSLCVVYLRIVGSLARFVSTNSM